MALSEEQKYQINKLVDYRDAISSSLFQIERILKYYFPEEFDLAYQHYIPQISTALHEDQKWLSRGGYSMQDTIKKLSDQAAEQAKSGTTSKFI